MFRKPFVAALVSSLIWPTSVLSAPNTRADSTKPKVILDNDWKATDFTPYLLALKAGWEVLGLISNTGDVWAKQATLHALATLEMGNLSSCIPVYYGADYPLMNSPELYRAWSSLYGKYPWEGSYAPENKTQEAQGGNPTGGDPRRINKAAFVEGLPNSTYVKDVSAAEFLVQTVRKYPGEVTIYSAGTLTNIALAQRLDSTFAQNTKGIVLMGGFIDNNLLAATGSYLQADLQTDFNLKLDPEASKIVLTAPFPNITLVGNGANQFIPSETFMQELHDVKTPYTEVLHKNLGECMHVHGGFMSMIAD